MHVLGTNHNLKEMIMHKLNLYYFPFTGEKVIILICDTGSLKSKDDKAIVGKTIERIINGKGKGFVAWLNDGKLSVDPDVLVQFLISVPQAAATINQWCPPAATFTGQPVMLRSLLRYGRISYQLEDIQLWDPAFLVPDYINEGLFHQHCNTPVTGVKIVLDDDGKLRWSVDLKLIEISRSRYEGIHIAANETLLLKTCIRNGQVSFEECDVHFRHGNFQISQNIAKSLRDEYYQTPCGELHIISNEKRDFRCVVKIGTINRMRTFASKHGRL